MGGLSSKHSVSLYGGKYRIKRQLRKLCVQRKRDVDVVQQLRPIRFFNITRTTVEASVTVDKKALLRAYLVPDGGTAATQLIEFKTEPDVDHLLEFENLKPGTLYRLKVYYVPDTCRRVLSSTRRGLLQSIKSGRMDGPQVKSQAPHGGSSTEAVQHGPDDVLIRRATKGAALDDSTGKHEELAGVSLPREGFPGEKPLGVPINHPKKLEVRTLPVDWKGKESLPRRATTRAPIAAPTAASLRE